MSVRAKAEVKNPDAIEVEITMTMPLGEWRQIAAAINEHQSWPYWSVAAVLQKVIRGVTKQVYEVEATE